MQPHWPRIANILASHGIRTTPEALSGVQLKVMRDIDHEAQINQSNDNDRLSVFFSQILDFAGAVGTREARRSALAEVRRVHAEENLWEHVPDDVIPALDRFKALGLNLIVLLNANGTVRKRFERLGMSRWLSHIVDNPLRLKGLLGKHHKLQSDQGDGSNWLQSRPPSGKDFLLLLRHSHDGARLGQFGFGNGFGVG